MSLFSTKNSKDACSYPLLLSPIKPSFLDQRALFWILKYYISILLNAPIFLIIRLPSCKLLGKFSDYIFFYSYNHLCYNWYLILYRCSLHGYLNLNICWNCFIYELLFYHAICFPYVLSVSILYNRRDILM